jgi:hypothetical protein
MCKRNLKIWLVMAVLFVGIILATAQLGLAENLVVNGGFETVYDTNGPRPTGYGYWQGNISKIVPASQGITPFQGSQMLNFIYTTEAGPGGSVNSEVWQIIDINSIGAQTSAGQALVSASFRFNRVDGDAQTDTEFGISLYAYAGDPCSFPSQYESSELAARMTSAFSDGDPNTWELATIDLVLPTNTDFFVIEVAASENIFNDGGDPEFDGHYADAVSVTICSRPIIYVDANANGANDGTSWEDAFNYLQDGLAAAIYGDQVWVAGGTYKPDEGGGKTPGDRTATFQLVNWVAIYGGYAGVGEPDPNQRDVELYETILSGDLDGNDTQALDPCDLQNDPNRGENSYHVVVTGSGTDATPVLDGFTITAGNANGWPWYHIGGGMYNEFSSPTVSNCTFTGNSADGSGGMFNKQSSPTVTNCTFSGNSARIDGGGMCNWEESSPILTNCVFSGNSAGRAGGGMVNFDSTAVTNCTFSGNSAVIGGGMMNYADSSPTVSNCTFAGNSAVIGGGMSNLRSSPTVTNCILWGNTASDGNEIALFGSSTIEVNYCDIQGGTAGVHVGSASTLNWGSGNINVDPFFVDANGPDDIIGTKDDDLRLLADSNCIDAGDNDSIPQDMTDLDGDGNTAEPIPWDLDGNARIVDGNSDGNAVVDMGAYEYFVPPIEVAMKFTPQAMNPGSKGKWVKAHFVLPEEYAVEDVDVDSPAKITEPFEPDIDSNYVDVFVNDDDLVEVEAAFERSVFCEADISDETIEVTVVGSFMSGQQFYGTDIIKITNNHFEYLAALASHWLEAECGKPGWCEGTDLDQDSAVNFIDFALFDGCCIEVIEE